MSTISEKLVFSNNADTTFQCAMQQPEFKESEWINSSGRKRMERIASDLAQKGSVSQEELDVLLTNSVANEFKTGSPHVILPLRRNLQNAFARCSESNVDRIKEVNWVVNNSLSRINDELVSENLYQKTVNSAGKALTKAHEILKEGIKDFGETWESASSIGHILDSRPPIIAIPRKITRADVLKGLMNCSNALEFPYDKMQQLGIEIKKDMPEDRESLEQRLKNNPLETSHINGWCVEASFAKFPEINLQHYQKRCQVNKTSAEVLQDCILQEPRPVVKVPQGVTKADVLTGLAGCSNKPDYLYEKYPAALKMIKDDVTADVVKKNAEELSNSTDYFTGFRGKCIETSLEKFPVVDVTGYVHNCNVHKTGEEILNECILNQEPFKDSKE